MQCAMMIDDEIVRRVCFAAPLFAPVSDALVHTIGISLDDAHTVL